MLKAVLFDIDGVLIDSFTANTVFYHNLFTHAGYPGFTKDDMKRYFHLTMRDVIIQHTKEQSPQKIDVLANLGIHEPYPSNLLVIPPGAQSVVIKLAQIYRVAIVTGRVKRGVQVFLDVFGGSRYFSEIVGAEDYSRPKPDPEPLRVALKKLALTPASAIYIGDMLTDVEAAHAAGMKAVAYGPLHPLGADAYFDSFPQLPPILKSL